MIIELKGIEGIQSKLRDMSTQVPYAAMLTVNELAFEAQKSLNAELSAGLNTRVNTSKAFVVDKAKKTNLVATVRMKSDWHYLSLQHHYQNKEAYQIAFEREMINLGFMSDNNSAIPLKKMSKNVYAKLLYEVKTGIRVKSKGALGAGNKFVIPVTNKSKSKRASHLSPGIYQRKKNGLKLLMLFTPEAKYKKRFDMRKTVTKVFDRRAEKYFFKNLRTAMKSAR